MASMQGYDQGAQPEERKKFDIMPRGDYVGQIVESEIKPNRSGTGQVMHLTWELLNEGFKGRKVWQYINVQHGSSPEAHRIGQVELANLKAALGFHGTVPDTLVLHSKACGLELEVEIGEGKYAGKDKNIVAGFFPAMTFGNRAATGPGVAAQAPAQVAAPAPAPVAPTMVWTVPPPAPAAQAPIQAPAAPAAFPWLKQG